MDPCQRLLLDGQLAGGVAALLFTVLSGSFPLLPLDGPMRYLSYTSFVRWGMEALLSVEDAPWCARARS